jgi:low affinity Fe/Cu permease
MRRSGSHNQFVLLAIYGFPGSAEELFSVIASSVTVIMIFVIQHTQSRLQTATQLKLDELIRTSPHADDLLVHIESAADNELIERETDQISLHSSFRE